MGRIGCMGHMGRRQWDNGTYKSEGNMLHCAPAPCTHALQTHYDRLPSHIVFFHKPLELFASTVRLFPLQTFAKRLFMWYK